MKSKISLLFTPFLALIAVYATFSSLAWGVDFHHDGYNFFQIDAMAQGKIAYKDFLIFKGPLYPFFVNQIIFNQSIYIYQVKLLDSILGLIAALLIKLILNKTKFRKSSSIVAILWLATNPAWAFLPNTSWPGNKFIDPNYLSIVLMLASAYCFMYAQNNYKFNSILSGIFMGLTPWVQQKGLLFPVFFIIISLITRFWKSNDRDLVLLWFFSFLVTLMAPIIWLIENKIFNLWLTQTILDPLTLASNHSVVASMSLLDMVTRSAVFLLMTCICICFSFLVNYINKIRNVRVKAFAYVTLLLSVMLLPFAGILDNIDPTKNLDLKNWIILISSWLPNMIWYSSFFGFIIILMILLYEKITINYRTKSFKDKQNYFLSVPPIETFFLSMGLASVFFLYPNFGYFWWFAPISFISCILVIENSKIKNHLILRLVERIVKRSVFIPLVASGLILFLIADLQPKFSYSEPKLKHITQFSKKELEIKETELKFMANIKDGNLRMNDCLDVFLLINLPKTVSLDRYFGPLPIREFSVDKNNFTSENVITCKSDINSTLYKKEGYEKVKSIMLQDGRTIILWHRNVE